MNPHTHIEGRQVVLVGKHADAKIFSTKHNLDERVPIATNAAALLGYHASGCHIVVLPSFWDLRSHTFVLSAVRRLERLGAFVEWV